MKSRTSNISHLKNAGFHGVLLVSGSVATNCQHFKQLFKKKKVFKGRLFAGPNEMMKKDEKGKYDAQIIS